jgi:hypothetical protein
VAIADKIPKGENPLVPMTAVAPRAPYSLEPAAFPLPALAALAGRAPLGGEREVALACLVVARLVADRLDGGSVLTVEQRRARAKGARQWLGTAAVPAAAKSALTRLAEETVDGDGNSLESAMGGVMAVTANQLDPAARLELGRLAQAVAE